MDDTDTKIAVSSISEISTFNMERIITVKGEIDNMSKAEAEISSKLRAAYEADVQAMAVSSEYYQLFLSETSKGPTYSKPTLNITFLSDNSHKVSCFLDCTQLP